MVVLLPAYYKHGNAAFNDVEFSLVLLTLSSELGSRILRCASG